MGLALAFFFFLAVPSFSQNTKGDKPTRSQTRTIQKNSSSSRQTKAKANRAGNKRIKAKNKSTASRALQSIFFRRNTNNPSRGDRSVKTDRPRVKSTTAKTARNNIYPQFGPFVNNPSRRPATKQNVQSNANIVRRIKQNSARQSKANIYSASGPYVNNPSKKPTEKPKVYSNREQVNRLKKLQSRSGRSRVFSQKGPYVNNTSRKPRESESRFSSGGGGYNYRSNAWPPGKKRIGYRSASGNFVSRGRKNVYWGKFSKGERPITTDITGRALRAKNFRTPFLGIIPAKDPYKNRKKKGDQSYSGTFRSGFISAGNPNQRAWRGDISGQPLRRSTKKTGEISGQKLFPRKLSISGNRKSAYLPGSGYRSRSGKISNQPIPARAPGVGASRIQSFISKLKGRKTQKGGGSVSGKGFNNNGRPIDVKAPAGGAIMGRYQGNIKGGRKTFSNLGHGYSGNIKSKRIPKGGGSISGSWNNNGNPIFGREPKQQTIKIGIYQGSFKQGELSPGFSKQGIGFSGNIKSRRPEKGGGSISGRLRNNNFRPIDVRAPRSNLAARAGTFQGNIKTRRPEKGGGSISGVAKNNNFSPIDVKAPRGKDAMRVGAYQGNLRARERDFRDQGEGFSGYLKTKRPAKGGGSVSGKLWNNNFSPIDVKAPAGKYARKIGTYQGNLRAGGHDFHNQGEEFTGYLKAKKPAKGGGSVSGKLWNNNEKPIDVRTPLSEDAKAANYSGKIRLSRFKKNYVKNPYAAELALKQQRPHPTTFDVDGLQIKVKQAEYDKKPNATKLALLGIGPGKNSVKASEYSGRMKVFWSYKHNPSSADDAMKTIAGTKSFEKATSFSGRYRLTKNYRHNPTGNKDALMKLEPSKAYAKINNYQGNLKMRKYNGHQLHPDAQFAHGYRNNVKEERTILMNFKLFWSKLIRKNSTQPTVVKEKVRRPRYDKKEKELWKDLYD